jgi:hypothetical protein
VRRAAKIDVNQPGIVKALRGVGASVQSLAAVGKGCPDLLVGFRGVNYVLEVKDGERIPSQRRLTPLQGEWHEAWRGRPAVVVETQDEALAAIGALAAPAATEAR